MAWRLGTVPYLNADPLAAALREPDAARLVGEAVQLRGLVPSELLRTLLAGELDAAMVSTGGILPHAELRILPGMCVASRGPVRSIQLYCRKPLEDVRTVALDRSSRSAVALTRVLFAERWRTFPEFVTLPPHLPSMLEPADAALLIGNPALLANEELDAGRWSGPPVRRFDLGAEWDSLTGLPFVYAVWAARTGTTAAHGSAPDLERLTRVLHRAKAWGMGRLELLAAHGAAELVLPPAVALEYLTHAIHYDLGERERQGMERFCELAIRHRVLPPESAVRFAETALAAR